MSTAPPGRNGAFPLDARSAAELYIGKGLAPVPLFPRSKQPVDADYLSLRLTAASLDEHFPPSEARNIGVLNGEPSHNAHDVDLDCSEAVRAAPLLLPPTGWVFGRLTAPKSHRIYRTNIALPAAQEPYRDLNGAMLVELRGTGGQTVFPPSVHKDSGECIAWVTLTDPAKVALADLQRAVREVAACSLLARHWPAKGTRQDAFLAVAGGLLRSGWQQDRTERFVEALAVATGDEEDRKRVQTVMRTAAKQERDGKTTGWPTVAKLLGEHGDQLVRQVREWLDLARVLRTKPSTRTVRALEPYRPFPVEALPSALAEYVRQGALALNCDPAYLALPVLAVAASVIGNTRTIRLKRGWEEPCIIWSAIVGDSGTLKSPAYLKGVAYLFRVQRQLLNEYKAAKARYEEEKQKAKDDDQLERPVLHRVVCSDTTIEKLAEILEDNPRGILVARDELAGWLSSFGRYKGKQGGTDLPNWLEMFRAGTVVVDRKTADRQTLYIQRAAVSITGGIQPGVLANALTPAFLDAGLAARLLMAMPPRRTKRWSEAEVASKVEEAYQETLDKLLALDFQAKKGEKEPHVLTLSPDGKTAWVAFYDSWAKEQVAVEGELAAAYSKLEAYAARIALIHHTVTHVSLDTSDLRPIGPRSIEAGITLACWFAGESRRIYSMLSETAEERDARRLVEFIQAKDGRITVRHLQRANSRKYPTSEHAQAALDALVEAGLGTWLEPARTERGGQPARQFVLHPTPDTTDTTAWEEEDDPDDERRPTPDTTLDTTLPNPNISKENRGSVGSVGRRTEGTESANGQSGTELDGGGSVGCLEVVSGASTYLLVRDRSGLDAVAAALDGTALVGLDLETTGLDPRTGRVRLISLACDTVDGQTFSYLVDCFAVDPTPLWEVLADKELVAHNAAFDLAFLARLGFTPAGTVHDTMLLAQLLTAGTNERVTLAACCERWLGRTLDKGGQQSDWSGALTNSQLAYAALDVDVLAPLFGVLAARVQEADLLECAQIEQRCLPAIVWMGQYGVALDREAWQALAGAADKEAAHLRQELHQAASPKPGELFGGWNWDSPKQAQEALALAGCTVEDTADETLAAVEHPLAQLLRRYRLARKCGTTYGIDWLAHVRADGRVYPSWRQIGAASGRMSCSDPNMQQLPRGDYRRCITAPPSRVLVKADYSQIELRIAAKVSGDQALLDAYQRGEDLHTITARNVLGKTDVTKQDRQLAKALNFGLLYGMGARGFCQYAKGQYGLDLTEEEARRYRDAFFGSYPGLAAWHRRVRSRSATETRTLAGRRRLLNDRTPDTHRLNTPVQGTGADGLKLALALLWERRDQAPGAFPVLAVHDEIVVEADAAQANPVAGWLKAAMLDAMAPLIEPVRAEVEVKVGQSWGGD